MSFSSSEYTSTVVNYLYVNDLITADVFDSTDLELQVTATVAAIRDLAQRANESLAPATGYFRTTQFMTELLEGHETLTGIGEHQGIATLADCMYLLSAIQKGTSITVEYPSDSLIVDIVQALPSAPVWMTYIHEDHEVTA